MLHNISRTPPIKKSLLFLFLMLLIQWLPSISAPIEWECTEAEPYRTTSLLTDRKEKTTAGLTYGVSDYLGVSQGSTALNSSFQDTVPPLASLQKTTINQITNSFAETNQALQNPNLSWWERMVLMRQGNAELEAMSNAQMMSTKVWEVGLGGAGLVGGSAGPISKLAKGTKIVKIGQWGKGLRQGTRLAPISEEISVFTKQRPTLVSRNLEGLDLKVLGQTRSSSTTFSKLAKKTIERKPASIQDQMTLEAAKRGAGWSIMEDLKDPNFKGMEKWEYKVKSVEGKDSVVHYVRDPESGQLMDFKFKKTSDY